MRPGRKRGFATGTVRVGTASLFVALETRARKLIGQKQARHRPGEARSLSHTIEKNVPGELESSLSWETTGLTD